MLRIRSPIFVPGNRRNMLEKATTFATDFVVPDLEDSVPPAEKSNARALVREMTPVLAEHGKRIMIRINSIDTGLAAGDIEAVVNENVSAISVGKVRSADDVKKYDELLTNAESRAGVAGGSIGLVLWMETAPAVLHAYEIATASPRVTAVTFGAEDYTRELGIRRTEGGDELEFARAMVALAAHAAGVTPIDTPYVNFRDTSGLEEDVRRAIKHGFKGKFAIHPSQLEPIKRLFGPQPEEIAYAHRVVEGWEKASAEGQGSFALDGKMIDIPVVERARDLIGEAAELEIGS